MTTEKAKASRYSARDLKNSCALPENSAEGLGSKRDCCWCYIISVFENTPKDLVFQRRVHLVFQSRVHSSHIVKVGVEVKCLHFNPWRILKELNKPAAHLELCHRNHDILQYVLNQIALYNNSTVRKCAPMQVIKQPEKGTISITEEKKSSSFQTKYY